MCILLSTHQMAYGSSGACTCEPVQCRHLVCLYRSFSPPRSSPLCSYSGRNVWWRKGECADHGKVCSAAAKKLTIWQFHSSNQWTDISLSSLWQFLPTNWLSNPCSQYGLLWAYIQAHTATQFSRNHCNVKLMHVSYLFHTSNHSTDSSLTS